PASPAPPAPPPVRQKTRARFSTLELLFNGAFSGFEGGLVGIALFSFLGTTLVSTGAWLLILAVLVFAQWRRWIERWDLIIIAGITLALVLFVPGLTANVSNLIGIDSKLVVLVIATLTAAVAIAVTAIFRLIYKLLSLIL
ncbi:hypothetical protein UH38_11720, partial [Aliterella atlantica CENA595]